MRFLGESNKEQLQACADISAMTSLIESWLELAYDEGRDVMAEDYYYNDSYDECDREHVD